MRISDVLIISMLIPASARALNMRPAMPGIAGRMFRALAEAGINIEMISTSEIRITCLVSRDQVEKGVRVLHKAFDLDAE